MKTNWKSVNVINSVDSSKVSNSSSPTKTSISQHNEKTNAFAALSKDDVVQPRLNIISNSENLPTPWQQSKTIPKRDNINQPENRYLESRKVDSKAEAKLSHTNNFNTYTSKNGPPAYVGSTFTHIPNAPNRPLLMLPKNPTIPTQYSPVSNSLYKDQSLTNQRSPDGSIIGSNSRKYISEQHVPYLAPDEPVGPTNPVKVLNNEWTACWDDQAGAIYYYNQYSGEATWLPPTI